MLHRVIGNQWIAWAIVVLLLMVAVLGYHREAERKACAEKRQLAETIEHAAPEFWSRALQAADIDVMKGLDVERWLCGLLKLRGYTPATTASDNTVRGTVCNRHGKAGPPGYQ